MTPDDTRDLIAELREQSEITIISNYGNGHEWDEDKRLRGLYAKAADALTALSAPQEQAEELSPVADEACSGECDRLRGHAGVCMRRCSVNGCGDRAGHRERNHGPRPYMSWNWAQTEPRSIAEVLGTIPTSALDLENAPVRRGLTNPQEGDAREAIVDALIDDAWLGHDAVLDREQLDLIALTIVSAFPVLRGGTEVQAELDQLKAENERLQQRNSDLSWGLYPDRMGQ